MTRRRYSRCWTPRRSPWDGHIAMNDILPIGRAPAFRGPRWVTPVAWMSLCCLFLTGVGCSIAPKRQQTDVRVHAESDISASFEQARLRVRALVQPMSGVIVASADQILAGTSDPTIRREALRWKIDAVPALREALFQPNPMTAVGDAWVLTFQMTDYFEQGPGAKALVMGDVVMGDVASRDYLSLFPSRRHQTLRS